MSLAFLPSSFTTHTYRHVYSVFLMVLSNLAIPQVQAIHIYAISSTEYCNKYFKILAVEKINVNGPLDEGSHSTLVTQ